MTLTTLLTVSVASVSETLNKFFKTLKEHYESFYKLLVQVFCDFR